VIGGTVAGVTLGGSLDDRGGKEQYLIYQCIIQKKVNEKEVLPGYIEGEK